MALFFGRLLRMLLLGCLMTAVVVPCVRSAHGDGVEGEDVIGEEVEDDEEEMEVTDEEEEEEPVQIHPPSQEDDKEERRGVMETEEEEEEEEEVEELKASPSAETTILFTSRPNNEFVAGEIVKSLIGFSNNGDNEFVVTGIEASFRYPQDFSYFIQNFSMLPLETRVGPHKQASFVYNFRPSESFYARAFGLTVNVYYSEGEDNQFRDAVFNGTVNIIELEEGFDAQTFFMYVFMVSGISLLMFIFHYVYTTVRRGNRYSKKPVETGTQNVNGVDYSWLPEGTIPSKKSPRTSPRSRKTKK